MPNTESNTANTREDDTPLLPNTEAPLASSTPLTEEHPETFDSEGDLHDQSSEARQRNDTHETPDTISPNTEDSGIVPTAKTPLLHRERDLESGESESESPGRLWRLFEITWVAWDVPRWLLLALIVVLAILVVWLFAKLAPVQAIVNSAVQLDVQGISASDFDDDGLTVGIVATASIDYNQYSGSFWRSVVKTCAVLLGGVYVSPQDWCSIRASVGPNASSWHVAQMLVPSQALDLINGRVTEVDFAGRAIVDVEGVRHLLEDWDIDFDKVLLEVTVPLRVQKFWFGVSTGPILMSHELPVGAADQWLKHFDGQFRLSDGLSVEAHAEIGPLPAELNLPAAKWVVQIPDCQQKAATLAFLESESVSVEPRKIVTARVSGVMPQVPAELLEVCNSGITPLNKLAQQSLMGRPEWSLEPLLQMLAQLPQQSLSSELSQQSKIPKWLLDLAKHVAIKIPMPKSSLHIQSWSLEEAGVQLRESSDKVGFKVDFTGQFVVPWTHILESAVEISHVGARSSILQDNIEIFQVYSSSKSMSQISVSQREKAAILDSVIHDIEVEITKPVEAGKLVNSVINGVKLPELSALHHIDTVDVLLSVVETTFRNLTFSLVLPAVLSLSEEHESGLDWFVANCNILSQSIWLLSSSATTASFLVDFEIATPRPVRLAFDTGLAFSLSYNDTDIGTVSCAKLDLDSGPNRYSNVSARLTLAYTSDTQRTYVEEFLSHVILASDVRLLIRGMVAGSPSLSDFIRQISVDVKVPKVGFREIETVQFSPAVESLPALTIQEKSPFLVGAIIHVWTSEIELTVFNPLENVEIWARIQSCIASYKGEVLAHIEWSELLMIPPGIYVTPRIPIKVAQGIGADILRRAVNGDLAVDVVAAMAVSVGEFPADLVYSGSGLTAKVRL